MSSQYQHDIESYIDGSETDVTMRCINWSVDIYVFTEQLSKVLCAKWRRVAYLQSGV